MIINSTGATQSDLTTELTNFENSLKTIYGSDFTIKKEGVIDNIAVTTSLNKLDIEDQIMFLTKQLNPYTAEGEFQDALYALIGLFRILASFTVVQRTVEGTPNTTIISGSLIISNSSTGDQFKLNDDCQLDSSGIGIGSFTAEEIGAIDLPTSAIINILTPLSDVVGVYYTSDNVIDIGTNYEDDAMFRSSWLASSVKAGTNTSDGMFKALLSVVDNGNNIKIRMNRGELTYNDLALHTMNIVLYSAHDDETIAKTIYSALTDGVGLDGNITEVVKDLSNQDVTIKFTRADVIDIYVKINPVFKPDYSLVSTSGTIKQAIINYGNTIKKYTMGESVVANQFVATVNSIEGIEYINSIKVSTNGTAWVDLVTMGANQVPVFSAVNITVN